MKWAIALIVVVVLAIVGKYAYAKYVSSPEYQKEAAVKEQKSLLEEVGKVMLLPEEEPAIFVVNDPVQLTSQQLFFKGAEKGDKLMVFQKAGKAVLYSTNRHMIINVGPVTFDQANANPGVQQSAQSATTDAKKK